MPDSNPSSPQPTPGVEIRPRRRPILTEGLIALAVVLFLALSHENGWRGNLSLDLLERFWILRPERIWDGEYRALLAAPFIHFDPIHLTVNLIFLWLIGNRVERLLGHQAMFAVVFFGAIVTTGCELAAGGWPMVGLSGVVCALLGLMLALARRAPMFHHFLKPPMIQILLGMLALAALLDLAGLVRAANVAHLSGLLFGWGVGQVFYRGRWRWPATAALASLSALAVIGATWMPYDGSWVTWRYLKARAAGQVDVAESLLMPSFFRLDANTLNNIAWRMATSYDASQRDGARAVELALRACEETQWQSAIVIDTLAAAYAETEQWEKAREASDRAVALVDEQLAIRDPRRLPMPRRELQAQALALRANRETIRSRLKIRE